MSEISGGLGVKSTWDTVPNFCVFNYDASPTDFEHSKALFGQNVRWCSVNNLKYKSSIPSDRFCRDFGNDAQTNIFVLH